MSGSTRWRGVGMPTDAASRPPPTRPATGAGWPPARGRPLARLSHRHSGRQRRLREGGEPMPLILWLLGVPLSLIVVLWLMGLFS
jgi:hypothetical protein